MPLPPFPTDETQRRVSGSATFKRAQAYAKSNAVNIIVVTDSVVEADVSGQEDYRVKLSRVDFAGQSICTCPAFDRRTLCKHVVATALVARDGGPEDGAVPDTTGPAAEEDLKGFLTRQNAARLAAWLSELADSDPAIEKRLRLFQFQQNPAALRKALGQLLRAPSFLDWRRSRAYARDVDSVIQTLASFSASSPADGLDLYQYALERLFKIYERSDDSGGDACIVMPGCFSSARA